MTPETFIAKWTASTRPERAVAIEHFTDLCRMLDEPTPNEIDPTGASYAFEKGATKTSGARGWADVWKRHHFALEYKGKGKDLTAAFRQLQTYALALDNPPLLAVCDIETFIIRTNWTNTVSATYTLTLEELVDPVKRGWLKAMLSDPERLKPGQTRAALTKGAAEEFSELAQRLRTRGHDAQAAAHFINRLVFCLFADDVELLPRGLFDKMLATARRNSSQFQALSGTLFAAMKDKGGTVGFDPIEWFNGGLFDDATALPLLGPDIELLQRVAALDWSEIDPSIFGTLFERGLDPAKRGQLGAHYTDRDKIMQIVEPVIIRPWQAIWETEKATIAGAMLRAEEAKTRPAKAKAIGEATAAYQGFLDRLRKFRVLDPACGSGNFLYVALLALKDIEHGAGLEAEALGLQREFSQIGPEVVKGIELSPYAAELARVSVWIGAIQWARRNGTAHPGNPILRPLDTIECRDALLNADGSVAPWPEADAIVGNPPFNGANMMVRSMGEEYVTTLRQAYQRRVPGSADFVCYWFDQAQAALATGQTKRVGLVSTQAIRSGASRAVLDRILEAGVVFDAWANEPWTVEGAAVRVALVCFSRMDANNSKYLNGKPVPQIFADLTAGIEDFTSVVRLAQNRAVCFMGFIAGGAFDVPGETAREWIEAPAHTNGRGNADVVRRWVSARDLLHKDSDTWIVDFGTAFSEREAAVFASPFAHVLTHVAPGRAGLRRASYRDLWWRFVEPRPAMRAALAPLNRCIVTPKVARHRVFLWVPTSILVSQQFYIFAREDDLFMGLLHNRFHQAWATLLASRHGVGNDISYTPTATFETFPFPAGLTPNLSLIEQAQHPNANDIADAACALVTARDRWLNPPEWVDVVPDILPHLPPRHVPRTPEAAEKLKARTLTALYNTRGTPEGRWLDDLHADLDRTVAAAYGWPVDITTDDALSRLLQMNRERAVAGAGR